MCEYLKIPNDCDAQAAENAHPEGDLVQGDESIRFQVEEDFLDVHVPDVEYCERFKQKKHRIKFIV